jgi:hypothetical protein
LLSQAVESWAAAGKLGVVRELIRRRARPGARGKDVPAHGDLPDAWEEGLAHEISAALAVSLRSAGKLIDLAWDLRARLPGVAAMLAGGTIDLLKARIVAGELSVLDDEQAAQAEKLILGDLAGKAPGQVGRLAALAVCTVDPGGARKRRERAERDEARVRFWREHGGAAALAACGLPTDEALAAHAAISERAGEYKKSTAFPDARMDQLRVLACLDLLNGVAAQTRIARARAEAAHGDGEPGSNPAGHDAGGEGAGPGGSPGSSGGAAGGSPAGGPGGDGPHGGNAGDGGSAHDDARGVDDPCGGEDPGDGGPDDGERGGPAPSLAALAACANLTIPLATLLGLAGRPGAGHGLGPLDPALARDLAATAAASPHSQWCVTVTDADGIAIGHGCARPARKINRQPGKFPRRAAGTNRAATSPATRCGTWSRSATASAPSRPAPGTPAAATSSTPSPTTRAAGPARATPKRAAENATRSSSPGDGA